MNGILDIILQNGFTITAAVAVIGLILNFLLKKFVTEENLRIWGNKIKVVFKGLGTACTLGLSKIPYVKSVWNSILEPYIILLLRMAIMNILDGFIQGLETDNKSFKE